MRMALVVEYEGSGYHGFQYQANASSIQEELEKAIARFTNESPRVKGAGRTDAGVHARCQVVAFDTDTDYGPETFIGALNHFLPDDIAVKAAFRVGGDFDPRRMALSRRYRYTFYCGATPSPLNRSTAYHVGDKLNVPRMRRAARHLVGVHDFAKFCGPLERAGTRTIREVFEAKLSLGEVLLRFDVEGNAFLPHQVRRMAGALVDVGRGRLTPDEVKALVDKGPGEAVAHTLPPHGLCLMKVTYSDFPPEDDE
jgi:tRNA pseudouridine38-40 synthase